MNIKKLLIIFFLIVSSVGGYYLYEYIRNLNYEKIDEEIDYWENREEELLEDKKKEKIIEEEVLSNIEGEAEVFEQKKVVIHIAGEVVNSGVFELNEGSRIIDAVNIAGGLTENADASKINLAFILSDEMKIYIPNKNETMNKNIYKEATEYITNGSGDNVSERYKEKGEEETIMININEATQTELETLPGIGPSTALKIIKYREENGNYTSIEDLKNVNGIGDSKFNNIKDLICV